MVCATPANHDLAVTVPTESGSFLLHVRALSFVFEIVEARIEADQSGQPPFRARLKRPFTNLVAERVKDEIHRIAPSLAEATLSDQHPLPVVFITNPFLQVLIVGMPILSNQHPRRDLLKSITHFADSTTAAQRKTEAKKQIQRPIIETTARSTRRT